VRRKVLLWFATDHANLLRRDVFPAYIAELPDSIYYGFPVLDANGHKVARHDGGLTVANPLELDRDVMAADEEECRTFLRPHLPSVNGAMRFGRVCMYTMTPDEHFIIDRHPEHPQVAIAAGFSGHGFKFASVVGELLADLADRGQADLPIDMFRIGRFS
jgi:glycine/D-amino acid oxidase-like deaminating enzyme